jgi:hypothetical protein
LETQAKQLSEKTSPKNVPIVVPVEFEDGPKDFGINPKAEVTVMLYKGLKVVANHAFAPGQFNQQAAEKVLADVSKIVE